MKDLSKFKDWLDLNYTGSEKTVQGYFNQVCIFFRQYEEMTQENLDNFFLKNSKSWKATTHASYIQRLRIYCKFANINIKFPKAMPKEKNVVVPYIKEKEMLDIVNKIHLVVEEGFRAKVFLLLLFYTGLRPNEIINVKKDNFNFTERKLILQKTKTHASRHIVLPKSIINVIKDAFSLYPKSDKLLEMTYTQARYIIQRVNETMNPSFKLQPYSFRHGFAHDSYKKMKNSLKLLQASMGHTALATTAIYINVDQNEAFEETRKLIK